MDRLARNQLEKRLGYNRQFMFALGKFGFPANYYLELLAKLENNTRKAREEVERSLIQERLF